jgi:hypothetical protein
MEADPVISAFSSALWNMRRSKFDLPTGRP